MNICEKVPAALHRLATSCRENVQLFQVWDYGQRAVLAPPVVGTPDYWHNHYLDQ